MNRILLLCLLLSSGTCGAAYSFTCPLHPASFNPVPTPCFSTIPSHTPAPAFLADTIPPTLVCPPSDTLVLASGQCDTTFHYTVLANDNEPGFILIRLTGLASGSKFPVGVHTIAYLVTDLTGNTATCTFAITVQSPWSGSLYCNKLTPASLGLDCRDTLSVSDILDGGYGCPGNYLSEVDRTPPFNGNGPWEPSIFTIADLDKTYQVRVTELTTGNKCWGNVDIVDSKRPTAVCQNFLVPCAVDNLTPTFLKDSLGIAEARPLFQDNCGPITILFNDAVTHLPCDPNNNLSGTVLRTWTVNDSRGNTGNCQQTISRVRRFSDVTIPADLTLSCANADISIAKTGEPFVQVGNHQYRLSTAAYCELDANYYDTIQPMCDGSRRVRRSWKIYDLCQPQSPGNPHVEVQWIDIIDTLGPVIQCPPTVIVAVADTAVHCEGSADLPDFVVTDGCSRTTALQAYWTNGLSDTLTAALSDFPSNDPALGDTLAVLGLAHNLTIGANTLHYVATDQCGNTSTCQFTLIVWDKTPPTAVCDTLVSVYLHADGTFLLPAATLDHGSSDDCNLLDFKARRLVAGACQANDKFYDEVKFCCADIGDTVAVTLRIYDVEVPPGAVETGFAVGQYSDCTVQVQVLDSLAPACTPPPNVTVNCETISADLAIYGAFVPTCAVDSTALNIVYDAYDSVCAKGFIVRSFQTYRNGLPEGSCQQTIQVNYLQDYFVRFPNDRIVSVCDGTNQYGEPQFFGLLCEKMQVSYTDETFTVVPDACYKIERTWTIRNECRYDSSKPLISIPNPNPNVTTNHPDNLLGPTVSAPGTSGIWASSLVKLNPNSSNTTNYSTFWSANVNGYTYRQIIKILDTQDPDLIDCPASLVVISDSSVNDPRLWNELYWNEPITASHDLKEGSVDLSITARDACDGANVNLRYLLFLDLDDNGSQETVISSTNLPPANSVFFNNAFNPNYAGGAPRAFDERPVPFNEKYGFALQTMVSGKQKTALVRWRTGTLGNFYSTPQLPLGTHKIKWIVEDGCGNERSCEYSFKIQQGQGPVVVCDTALLRDITASHSVPVHISELPLVATDNNTPAHLLKFGIRKNGTGTGFPQGSNGSPSQHILFDCDDIGAQFIELWAQDTQKNVGYCLLPVTVQDLDSSCTKPLALLSIALNGSLKTELNTGISGASLLLTVTIGDQPHLTMTTLSDDNGAYQFNFQAPFGFSFTVAPTRDYDPLNGVSTYDLVLISKHILGLEPLNTPFKLIGADANRSGSITTFDIVELRKLILGIYQTLPANTSWRFVNKSYVFPKPTNPFQSPFPENASAVNLFANPAATDFVGVKIGDVNASASPNLLQTEDRWMGTLWFDLQDRWVKNGEVFDISLQAAESVQGYQFTLDFPDLILEEVNPGPAMRLDHFGVFPGALTTSFEGETKGEFRLRFQAKTSGLLSQLLHTSSRITTAEAYGKGGLNDKLSIGLRFADQAAVPTGFELYQNNPNPFTDQTVIGFNLPNAAAATLTVFDANGRELYRQSKDYTVGYHTLTIDQTVLGTAGVLFYKLETTTDSAIRKMVRLR